jgi:hypothetical protein
MSEELVRRINNYLGNGGLFNPEMMEHDKVRDLLLACRDYLSGFDVNLDKLKKDYAIVCQRERIEAQLACDLRTTQDQVIERCAQAIRDKWPEAAETLRRHVDGISGEDWGELNRELAKLREQLTEALEMVSMDAINEKTKIPAVACT